MTRAIPVVVQRSRPKLIDACPCHPHDDGPHECLPSKRTCVYCGAALEAYTCHGCGKFLTAAEMHVGGRCEACQ